MEITTDIYAHALKLLRNRDYTVAELCRKLEAKFGNVPGGLIEQLLARKFLDDHRYAGNFVRKHRKRGPPALRQELELRGVSPEIAEEVLSAFDWPSPREAARAKMNDWNLRAPLQPRDAGRLFRALVRLGYDEDAVREEIEQLQ